VSFLDVTPGQEARNGQQLPPQDLPPQVLARLFHELRRPLSSIQAHGELLADGIHGQLEPAQQESVERIHGACVELASEMQRLHDLWVLPLQTPQRELPEMDLVTIVEQVARRAGAPVMVQTPPGPVLALAHPEYVSRAVSELIENAITHGRCASGAPATVRVVVSRSGDMASIQVRDEGPGIPKAECSEVFDAHRQGTTCATGARGLGIGLALARIYARYMGGEVELLEAAGGTTVALSLRAA